VGADGQWRLARIGGRHRRGGRRERVGPAAKQRE